MLGGSVLSPGENLEVCLDIYERLIRCVIVKPAFVMAAGLPEDPTGMLGDHISDAGDSQQLWAGGSKTKGKAPAFFFKKKKLAELSTSLPVAVEKNVGTRSCKLAAPQRSAQFDGRCVFRR